MKLLTPTEYADAYQFWTDQETRLHATEVEAQITPHSIRVAAENHRIRAILHYGMRPEQIHAHRTANTPGEAAL